ncbi:hypothetical protein D3C81_1907590 [compost metagenome]
MRERATAALSVSRMLGRKAPTRSRWVPGCNQSPRISGEVEVVTQLMQSACWAQVCRSVAAWAG